MPKLAALFIGVLVVTSASAYILANTDARSPPSPSVQESASKVQKGLEVQTANLGPAEQDLAPRPAIIAQFEYGLPAAIHPELALSHEVQETLRLTAGVPNATRHESLEQVGGMIPVNTFIRYNGSKILGSFLGEASADGTERERALDDHATATMSMIAGNTVGSCPDCLVVALDGTAVAMAWVMHQTWIDAVSISGWIPGSMPLGAYSEAIAEITASGKPVFLANGNLIKPPTYDSGFYMSPAIAVTMIGKDGNVPADYTLGADIAALGEADVPYGEDGYHFGMGTSYSAPYAAGMWGRFLMDAWAEGHLERVVEDGRVRNRILDGAHTSGPVLGDGWLDGREVKAFIGSFANPDPTFRINHVPIGPNPVAPAWTGYGALYESDWQQLVDSWDTGFPSVRDPEALHEANLMLRDLGEPVSRTFQDAVCTPVKLIGRCGTDRYFENDDWYR